MEENKLNKLALFLGNCLEKMEASKTLYLAESEIIKSYEYNNGWKIVLCNPDKYMKPFGVFLYEDGKIKAREYCISLDGAMALKSLKED